LSPKVFFCGLGPERKTSYTNGQNNLTQGRIAAAHGSVIFARWRQCAIHLIHASLGPAESMPQTFLHSSPRSVSILYNGTPPFPVKPAPSHGGSASPFNTWSPGPTQVHILNGISIKSAVSAGLTIVTDRQTDRPHHSVCNNRLHLPTLYCHAA